MRTSDDSEALIREQSTQARDVEELRNSKHSAIAPLVHGYRGFPRSGFCVQALAVLDDAIGRDALLDQVGLHCLSFIKSLRALCTAHKYHLTVASMEDGKRGIQSALESIGRTSVWVDGVTRNDGRVSGLNVIRKTNSRQGYGSNGGTKRDGRQGDTGRSKQGAIAHAA